MFDEIERFAVYLQDVKRMSQNTILSYRRDLLQFASYMEDRGVREAGKVTKTSLDSYILFLEKRERPLPLFRVCWPQSRHFFTMNFRKDGSGEIRQI